MPFESLKRTTRDRKYAVDAVEETLAGLAQAPAGDTPAAQHADVLQRLSRYISELQGLKRKVGGRLTGRPLLLWRARLCGCAPPAE